MLGEQKIDALEFRSPEHRDRLPGLIDRTGLAKKRALTTAEYMSGLVRGQAAQASSPGGMPFPVAGWRQRVARLRHCSTFVNVRDYFQADDYAVEAMRCRQHLICPSCAIFRGLNHVRNVAQRMEVLQSEGEVRPYLLTLGVRTGPDLAERYSHMSRSFRSVLDGRRVDRRQKGNELSALVGGVYSFESIRSKSGLWNSHCHALVLSSRELPVVEGDGADGVHRWYWPALADRWREQTGDSFIVECHPVVERCAQPVDDVAPEPSDLPPADGSRGLMSAVCEVSKYAVKLSDTRPEDVVEAWSALRGRRLIGSFGCFRGIEVVPEEDRVSRRELSDFVDRVYRFKPGVGGYSVESLSVMRSDGHAVYDLHV